METERICPNCRKALPPEVPLGLCPECLIKAGFPTGTEPGVAPASGFEPPPVEEIAKLFPQFEILSFIGKGGMGAVYQARQPGLDRLVALKVLPPAVASDPGFAERFNREARALARLSHPNIVVVYDFGKAGTLHYLVMEYVDGTNLREVERAGKLSSEQALAIVPQICEALQFAHNEGIVHRDIKPENLLLDKKGRVKIADFGIAKMLDVPAGKVSLTGAKDVVGTPHYMAPEQIERPQTVDHRADIYSLGVVFYEMLTGELPLGKFSPPSKKVQVDVRLDEVVLHALEKEPERRYQQASQVKTDVETITTTKQPPVMGAGAMASATAPPPIPAPTENPSDKIILPAFLLAFFFGIFGAHRFYVGKNGTAFIQLFTLGGLGIWATIDWILILCKVFTDSHGRRLTNWWHTHPGGPKPPPKPSEPTQPPKAAGQATGNCHVMIAAPAVGLMVVGFLKFFNALRPLFLGWPGYRILNNLFFHLGVPHQLFAVTGAALISIIPAALIIYGALQMIQLRCYTWAIVAAALAMVFCSLTGFLVGIWALVILLIPKVREAFRNADGQPACAKWPWYLGAAAVAGFVIAFWTSLLMDHGARPHKAQRLARAVEQSPSSASAPPLPAPSRAPAPSASATPVANPGTNVVINANGNTYTVAAPSTGAAPLSYQWYFNGTNSAAGGTNSLVVQSVTPAPGNGTGAQVDLQNQSIDIEDSRDFFHTFAASPGGHLTMKVDEGEVQITGADQSTVQIHVLRDVSGADDATAAQLLKDEHVVLAQAGNDISITSENPSNGRHHSFFGLGDPNVNARYEITVPRNFRVEPETAGGDVKVTGIQGDVTIKTSGGRLDCEDIGGDVDGHTDGGDVYANRCQGHLHLRTSGGNMNIEEFTGPDIEANTDGGSVSADFAKTPTGDCQLHTSGGNIEVRLPETCAVTLDAHTDGGGVRTDFTVQTSGQLSGDSIKGTVNGGGPMLQMETAGGNINISKR